MRLCSNAAHTEDFMLVKEKMRRGQGISMVVREGAQQGRAISIGEFCRQFNLSSATVYHLIHLGNLRAVKMGGSTRLLETDIRAWLKSLPEFQANGRGYWGPMGRQRRKSKPNQSTAQARAPSTVDLPCAKQHGGDAQ